MSHETGADIEEWLTGLGLAQYSEAFRANGRFAHLLAVIDHHRSAAHGEKHGAGRSPHLHAMTAPHLRVGEANLIVIFRIAQRAVETHAGEGERIKVFDVPLSIVEEWLQEQIGQGKVVDLKVYLGVFFLRNVLVQ